MRSEGLKGEMSGEIGRRDWEERGIRQESGKVYKSGGGTGVVRGTRKMNLEEWTAWSFDAVNVSLESWS